jgi:hypothetical protein
MKNMGMTLVGMMALSVFLLSGCATPEGRSDSSSGSVSIGSNEGAGPGGCRAWDRQIVREYYGQPKKKARTAPHGLAKREALPLGLNKRLERGDVLPPGLEERRLPDDLEARLTVLPKNYVRLRIGGDLIIKNLKTDAVVDIIRGVGE